MTSTRQHRLAPRWSCAHRRAIKLLAGVVMVAGTTGATAVRDAQASVTRTTISRPAAASSHNTKTASATSRRRHHTAHARRTRRAARMKGRHTKTNSPNAQNVPLTLGAAGFAGDLAFGPVTGPARNSPAQATPFRKAKRLALAPISAKSTKHSSHMGYLWFALAIAIALTAVWLISRDMRRKHAPTQHGPTFRGAVLKPSRTPTNALRNNA